MADNPAPAVYRVAELAKMLDMGERQVRERIKRGVIPCLNLDGQIRCSKVRIKRWLNGEEERDGLEIEDTRKAPESEHPGAARSAAA
jgi:hypothetical protein